MTGAWELDPRVALRTEPFGALAYHYGNRRLTFLHSSELVELVEALGDYSSIDEALAASQIHPKRWPAFQQALVVLADSEVIRRCG